MRDAPQGVPGRPSASAASRAVVRGPSTACGSATATEKSAYPLAAAVLYQAQNPDESHRSSNGRGSEGCSFGAAAAGLRLDLFTER